MLLPALSKAREKARQSVCMGNLKQIYTALRMYVNDYDGFLPPHNAPGASNWQGWETRILIYLGGQKPFPLNFGERTKGFGKVFTCPSDRAPWSSSITERFRRGSYGYYAYGLSQTYSFHFASTPDNYPLILDMHAGKVWGARETNYWFWNTTSTGEAWFPPSRFIVHPNGPTPKGGLIAHEGSAGPNVLYKGGYVRWVPVPRLTLQSAGARTYTEPFP
ncbi:MAG: DUF1559 domain-containing protein, partial [bacterium]|nr:DUF1559 domain-containing protein [bacterium]